MENITLLSEEITATTSAFTFENTSYLKSYNLNSTSNNSGIKPDTRRPVADGPSIYDYPEYGWSLDMYPGHTFFFVIAGMLGNLLALCIILRKNMRGMSSAVFVATLAMADNVALIGFLLGMTSLIYSKHIIDDGFCRTYFYMLSIGSMISAWTVVVMSFERVLIVTFPLKAPNWTSRTRAVIIEIIVVLCLLTHNMHFFWTAVENRFQNLCEYNYSVYSYFLRVWSIYDACISSYVPLILIFIMNGIIIVQMKRARNIQKAMSNAPSSNGVKSNSNTNNATNQITIMLLSVSTAFFLCMTPYGIFQIYINYVLDFQSISLKSYARVSFANQICLILWEINHSINVVLYSLTGRKFRNELISLFTCGKYNGRPKSSTYAATDTSRVTKETNGATSVTTVSGTV